MRDSLASGLWQAGSAARVSAVGERASKGTRTFSRKSTCHHFPQNLTMRMHMLRFTRLTNAFSKKVENHAYAVALHMMYYNFVRIHKTLRATPAMAAGVTDRLWEIADIVKLVEDAEAAPERGVLTKEASLIPMETPRC